MASSNNLFKMPNGGGRACSSMSGGEFPNLNPVNNPEKPWIYPSSGLFYSPHLTEQQRTNQFGILYRLHSLKKKNSAEKKTFPSCTDSLGIQGQDGCRSQHTLPFSGKPQFDRARDTVQRL